MHRSHGIVALSPRSPRIIDFRPGRAALRPEEQEKLDALTRALRERPRLQLVVSAPYDPQADARALQREQARRDLAQARGRRLEANENPGPIAFDDPATRRELERRLSEQAGASALDQLRQEFGGAADGGRNLYEAMFEKIAATQALRGSAMQALAVERAQTIADHLLRKGVGPEQVQTGRIVTVAIGKDGEVSAQLQVSAGEAD